MGILDKIKDIFDGDEDKKPEQHQEQAPAAESSPSVDVSPDVHSAGEVPLPPAAEAPMMESAPAQAPVEAAPVPEAAPQPRTYTVVEGDTLWGISEQFLGDGSRYPEIASLNGIENPDLIFPGQVITLP